MDEKQNERIKEAVGIIGRFLSENKEVFDEQNVSDELLNLGFSEREIAGAYRYIERNTLGPHWRRRPSNKQRRLQKAEHQQNLRKRALLPLRMLNHIEATKIDPKAHTYLLQLHSLGAIDTHMMEEIIERALGSAGEFISLLEIRRIAALYLFTRIQMVQGESAMNISNNSIH